MVKRPFHKLRVPDDVAALIRGLHPHLKKKVKASFEAILSNPNSGKALKDELSGLRSFRVGNLRVVYRISAPSDNKRMEVVAIGPRQIIYEETLRLIKKERPLTP